MSTSLKSISHTDNLNRCLDVEGEAKKTLNKCVDPNLEKEFKFNERGHEEVKKTIVGEFGLKQQSPHETISILMESDGNEDPGAELETEFIKSGI